MRARSSLWLILTAYALIGVLFALFTPDWESPDEPAHFNYVDQLAQGRLPVIEPGDYDQAYLTEVVFQSHFGPEYSLETIEYEDWQPPLYYLLQLPVHLLSGGSLQALRLFSLLLGAGVVALAYEVALQIFPGRRWIATISATFIAFLPQHIAILASVNNDSLAELLIAAMLLALVNESQTREGGTAPSYNPRRLRMLGILLGLGFLTKGTVYPMAVVISVVLLRRRWGDWAALLRQGLNVAVPSVILGSIWWVRNAAVYGGVDILGKAAHDAVVVGQPRTADLVSVLGLWEAVQKFFQTTFNSFWGQFGWMTVPLPGRAYLLLWIFTVLILVGLALALVRRGSPSGPRVRDSLLMLMTLLALTTAIHVTYNLTYEQHQGRYLFPALVPIGIGVAIGFETWMKQVQRHLAAAGTLLPLSFAAVLISLDLWALFGVLLPELA